MHTIIKLENTLDMTFWGKSLPKIMLKMAVINGILQRMFCPSNNKNGKIMLEHGVKLVQAYNHGVMQQAVRLVLGIKYGTLAHRTMSIFH